MRILHTSDWHLNARLGGRDRTPDLRRRVEEIAALCDAHAVDVLVIAGDVFSHQCRVDPFQNELADSLRHLRVTFRPFFDRGGTVLAVTGNHDQYGEVSGFLDIARAGMTLGERPRIPGDAFDHGKMYLLAQAFLGRVRDAAGYDVQFALMPFPKRAHVLAGSEAFTTAGEVDRVTQQFVADWIRELPNSKGFDRTLPAVFVGHIRTVNADLGRGLASNPDGLALDDAALPVQFAYVALGDVHKPQILLKSPHVRYSGSLDRMDFGEAGEVKSVVLVEVDRNGLVGTPTVLPLTSTELIPLVINDPTTAVPSVLAQVQASPDAIVKVVLEGPAAATPEVEAALRQHVPEVRVTRDRPEATLSDATSAPQGTVRERVMQYLGEALSEHPRRQAVMKLATRYLEQGNHT